MTRRTIRGCDRDRVTLVRAPDPLDVALGHKPADMLHLTAAKGDGYSGACSWTVLLTLAGAIRAEIMRRDHQERG